MSKYVNEIVKTLKSVWRAIQEDESPSHKARSALKRPMPRIRRRNLTEKQSKDRLLLKRAQIKPNCKATQTDPRAEVLWLQQLMSANSKKKKMRRHWHLAKRLHISLLLTILGCGVLVNSYMWVEVLLFCFYDW